MLNLKLSCCFLLALFGMLSVSATPIGKDTNVQQQKNTRLLTGVVIDAATGETLIGATVVELNTTNGAVTNMDGEFSINLIGKNEIEVSYIGYKKAILDVSNISFIEVKLQSDNELEEVVIVGAGSQKKISVTGAINSVTGEQLKTSSSSLTTNLAGKLAGVISMTNSGEPGRASEFYIRGIGTFGGRSTPLILLDDVEISSGDLNRIPAETIASFTVLKDASATAIYGVRGANGVMLITTKNGEENTRAKIGVSIENSFQQPMRFPEFVDGGTWMELYNEGLLARGGSTPRYTQDQIDLTRSHQYPYTYPDVDWAKVLFRDFNMNQRANINITGGGNRITYYMSLNFSHDTGIVNAPGDYVFNNNIHHYNYNFQNNLSYKLSNITKISLNLNAQIGEKRGLSENPADLFNYMYNANPVLFPATLPSEESDDHIRFGTIKKSGNTDYRNPYAAMMDDYSVTKDNKLNVLLKLDQKLDFITQGLAVNGLVNWNNYSRANFYQSRTPYYYLVDNISETDPSVYDAVLHKPGDQFITEKYNEPFSDQVFYFDTRLNYNRKFGDHTLGGLLMYMMRDYRPNKALSERNQGLSGRVTYDFAQRYFAEVNFGYNGTERLAKENRFELFPAVSAGWVPSNEAFWEPLGNIVDYLKIRGSYGLVGSDGFQNFSHFTYFDEVSLNGGGKYIFGPAVDTKIQFTSPGVTAYAVDGATWERVKKLDIGVDFSLFREVNVTFDYFKDRRERIMLKRGSWPDIAGYWSAVPWGQVGEAENHGVEFSVNWTHKFNKDWEVDLRSNFTYTQNKYLEYDEPDYPYVWQTRKGKPLDGYRVMGYIAEGLFASEEEIAHSPDQQLGSQVRPGDIKYRDVDGNGIINSLDEVMISPYGWRPRIQYGIGSTVRWKKWDLGVFFNGSAKRSIYISGITPFGNDLNNVMKFISKDHWSMINPNPDAAYPRLGITDSDVKNNTVTSTYWLRNGNFIRFKTLEVGYNFKLGRLYLNGDNIAVWSPFKLWDPELAWNAYPLSRTFTLGMQFHF
ncbi:SusC/RagA family TonB-linked outer membrane protein [Proteiniphilum sp. UBA5384]|uniref:SusC/RagA family TonB-linked outer membrane protein n=1 Tax=Proteiniphilum sp. UBA5384 TaxID=1947279 RepID=UPI0025D8ED63|nr:TonB-dependent receptor [Proteiniphilum sp. UBA5384]